MYSFKGDDIKHQVYTPATKEQMEQRDKEQREAWEHNLKWAQNELLEIKQQIKEKSLRAKRLEEMIKDCQRDLAGGN